MRSRSSLNPGSIGDRGAREEIPFFGRSRSLGLAPAAALAALILPGLAMAAPYTVARSTEPFVALPLQGGTASTIMGNVDDVQARIPVGFDFQFFDRTYSSVTVSSNGYLTFEPGSSGTARATRTFPDTANPTDILAVWLGDAQCPGADAIRSQTIGSAPNRRFVIEWNCRRYSRTELWKAQAWLSEGSSTMSVLYGTYAGGSDYTAVTVGVQNRTATEYAYGLGCAQSCSGTAWPTGTRITYTQGPELTVTDVRVPAEGYAGIRMPVSVSVRNSGGALATGFTVRLYVSPVPTKSAAARVIATSQERRSAEPGEIVTFGMSPQLPIDLESGNHYVIAEADPDHVVPVANRASTLGSSPAFALGVPAPNLLPRDVSVAGVLEPGKPFDVYWTAANEGTADAVRVPYVIVLSAQETAGPASLRLARGNFDLRVQESLQMVDRVSMPADIATGLYHVGVIVDPELEVFEHERNDNIAVSRPTLVSTPNAVSIVTAAELPDAEVGSPYTVLLEASGGDGVHAWSVAPGSRLPPGLALEESPAGARETGLPFVTMLTGTPSATGDFEIALAVRSGSLTGSRTFRLGVFPSLVPLSLSTSGLPTGSYDTSYSAALVAAGGRAPYVWSLAAGKLPPGLRLDVTGVIEGRPLRDGRFPFMVRVTDANGTSISREIELVVVSPTSVACGTSSLPPRPIGEPFDDQLHAAGATTPTFTTRETNFLATRFGDEPQWRSGEAPPGLSISPTGRVTGVPTRIGSYEWLVDVRDAQNPSGKVAVCVVRVDVLLDRGLTVTNRSVPDAFLGQPYAVQLEATGGVGATTWKLLPGEKLPSGITLSREGLLAGVPDGADLAGEDAANVAFLVRAADSQDRAAVVALSVTVLRALPGPGPGDETTESGGGCQSAGAGTNLAAAVAILGAVAIRRRPRTR